MIPPEERAYLLPLSDGQPRAFSTIVGLGASAGVLTGFAFLTLLSSSVLTSPALLPPTVRENLDSTRAWLTGTLIVGAILGSLLGWGSQRGATRLSGAALGAVLGPLVALAAPSLLVMPLILGPLSLLPLIIGGIFGGLVGVAVGLLHVIVLPLLAERWEHLRATPARLRARLRLASAVLTLPVTLLILSLDPLRLGGPLGPEDLVLLRGLPALIMVCIAWWMTDRRLDRWQANMGLVLPEPPVAAARRWLIQASRHHPRRAGLVGLALLTFVAIAAVASQILAEYAQAPQPPPADAQPIGPAHLSPDGRVAVIDGAQRQAVLWQLDSLTARWAFPQPIRLDLAGFSPDGTFVAAGDGIRIAVRRVADGQVVGRLTMPAYRAIVGVSPDGSWLVVRDASYTLTRYRVADGHILGRMVTAQEQASNQRLSPDGTWLAVACRDGTVEIWRVPEHQRQTTLRDAAVPGSLGAVISDLAFTPDGGSIVVASPATITVWRLSDGVLLARLPHEYRHAAVGPRVGLSPDGRRLAVLAPDGGIALWHFPTGPWQLLVPGDRLSVGRYRQVAFSPDGRELRSTMYDPMYSDCAASATATAIVRRHEETMPDDSCSAFGAVWQRTTTLRRIALE